MRSSRISRSLVRAPMMQITLLPASFNARVMGCNTAIPVPPPTQTTLPTFSTWVGLPRGPMTSWYPSPTCRVLNRAVDLPTTWYITVMVPFSGSVSAMVSGMRSPVSFAFRITNWPGLALRAIRGASISLSTTVPSDISSRLTILNMLNLLTVDSPARISSGV